MHLVVGAAGGGEGGEGGGGEGEGGRAACDRDAVTLRALAAFRRSGVTHATVQVELAGRDYDCHCGPQCGNAHDSHLRDSCGTPKQQRFYAGGAGDASS